MIAECCTGKTTTKTASPPVEELASTTIEKLLLARRMGVGLGHCENTAQ
jgi:hypothetical protein